METKEKIRNNITKWINDNRHILPTTLPLWDILVNEMEEKEVSKVQFGKNRSRQTVSTPFYKPFSKIISR